VHHARLPHVVPERAWGQRQATEQPQATRQASSKPASSSPTPRGLNRAASPPRQLPSPLFMCCHGVTSALTHLDVDVLQHQHKVPRLSQLLRQGALLVLYDQRAWLQHSSVRGIT
jgi:hypothetical protein